LFSFHRVLLGDGEDRVYDLYWDHWGDRDALAPLLRTCAASLFRTNTCTITPLLLIIQKCSFSVKFLVNRML